MPQPDGHLPDAHPPTDLERRDGESGVGCEIRGKKCSRPKEER